MVAGTTNQRALEKALKEGLVSATVVTVKSRDEGVAALEGGSADAMAGDRILLAGLISKLKDPSQYELLDQDLSFEPYAIVLPRNEASLRLAVNRALAQITRRLHRRGVPTRLRANRETDSCARRHVRAERVPGVMPRDRGVGVAAKRHRTSTPLPTAAVHEAAVNEHDVQSGGCSARLLEAGCAPWVAPAGSMAICGEGTDRRAVRTDEEESRNRDNADV